MTLFSDMKRSGCRVAQRPSISRGKRRGCCRASTRKDACPRWDSHRVASHEIGAPSNSRRGNQVRCSLRIAASSRLSTDLVLFSLGSLPFFWCLAFLGPTSPSSNPSTSLFRLKLGISCNAASVVGGRGGGALEVVCSFGGSLEDYPLFLLDRRPLRPDLGFRSMPSSSISWLISTWAITKPRLGAAEARSISESESESSTSLVDASPSSEKWNWSIWTSRDECEESAPSPRTISARRTRWAGSWTGCRSLRARKPGMETSMRASRGLPALMA